MPDAPLPPELLRIARTGDALTAWERAIVGRAARLEIQLMDQVALRRVAPVLRVLASALEVLSDPRQHPNQRSALFQARAAVEAAKNALRQPPDSPIR